MRRGTAGEFIVTVLEVRGPLDVGTSGGLGECFRRRDAEWRGIRKKNFAGRRVGY